MNRRRFLTLLGLAPAAAVAVKAAEAAPVPSPAEARAFAQQQTLLQAQALAQAYNGMPPCPYCCGYAGLHDPGHSHGCNMCGVYAQQARMNLVHQQVMQQQAMAQQGQQAQQAMQAMQAPQGCWLNHANGPAGELYARRRYSWIGGDKEHWL